MKLFKIKLGQALFWSLEPIVLNNLNEYSSLINAEDLTDEQVKVIKHSLAQREISIYDSSNSRISSFDDIDVYYGSEVSAEDIKEEEDQSFEIESITVSGDEPEEELSADSYKEAEIFLDRNGNTVRKAVGFVSNDEEGKSLLMACLELELSNRKRNGIIKAIESKLKEF